MDIKRYIEKNILEDLKEKMVFLGGPRQVGKTTLSLRFIKNGNESHPTYLNWDSVKTKQMLLNGDIPGGHNLLIFDEIHKSKNWRNLVKGFYDQFKSTKKFLITGSARLDYYRRGGDSLQGRYHYHRLHPLSLFEINNNPTKSDFDHLLQFGGFPEPFLKGNERHWKRWQRERQSRVIHEDLINLEYVKEISQLDLLTQILPEKIGSILSINNLRQDLSVAFETAERWLKIFENLYYCFRISPHGLPKLRTAKKEKKLYLWDWSLCTDSSPRFENLVASNLLKFCHYIEDTEGDKMDLRFLRDSTKREIDFMVVKNSKVLFAVACKTGEKKLCPNINYFSKKTDIPYFYQVHSGTKDFEVSGVNARVLPFTTFCKELKYSQAENMNSFKREVKFNILPQSRCLSDFRMIGHHQHHPKGIAETEADG